MKPRQKQKDSQLSEESLTSVRALIGFPPDVYQTLKKIVVQKRQVSPAWVVREAAEQYIEEECPLLRKSVT